MLSRRQDDGLFHGVDLVAGDTESAAETQAGKGLQGHVNDNPDAFVSLEELDGIRNRDEVDLADFDLGALGRRCRGFLRISPGGAPPQGHGQRAQVKLKAEEPQGATLKGNTGSISRVEGIGLRGGVTPRHRQARAGRADETRRIGE
jgi:hypothetical protein